MKIRTLIHSGIERLAARLIYPIENLSYHRYYNFPFGNKPLADVDTYREIWQQAKSISYPIIDQFEKTAGFAIDQEWLNHLALLTQVVVKPSEICYQHGRLLYTALSQYIAQYPSLTLTILETGTARGFSALCMAKALDDQHRAGKIITIDVLPHHIKMYWNCIADNQGAKSRAELLNDYQSLIDEYLIFCQGDSKIELNKIEIPRIHFAFLDSRHTYDYVMAEFAYVNDHQKPGDIIVFDDYTPGVFPGIVKAVDEICNNHGYQKQTIEINMQRGYAITQKQ